MTECLAIAIAQKTQVNSELLLSLCTGQNDKLEFSMIHGIAWK